MALLPVVGYQGGKRRLLPRLRTYLNPAEIAVYVEPFVGMGAVYLDLRDRGYEGPAVLADINDPVRMFWSLVHDPASASLLMEHAVRLASWPATPDGYEQMKREPATGFEQVARFLWITNFAFGNTPPVYDGTRWRVGGTKLTSAARWGKKFAWTACVERLQKVIGSVAGRPVRVGSNGLLVLAGLHGEETVYADPPYRSLRGYTPGDADSYVQAIAQARARKVLFSEQTDLSTELPGWAMDVGEVVARQSARTGAAGKRREVLYIKQRSSSRAGDPPASDG